MAHSHGMWVVAAFDENLHNVFLLVRNANVPNSFRTLFICFSYKMLIAAQFERPPECVDNVLDAFDRLCCIVAAPWRRCAKSVNVLVLPIEGEEEMPC